MLKRVITGGLTVLIFLLHGCAATSLRLEPATDDNVSTRYEQGLAVLQSRYTNEATVTLLDASAKDLLFEVSVRNRDAASFDFSTANIALILRSKEQELPGRVYSYAELDSSADDELTWDGADVVFGTVTPQIIGGGGGITSAVLHGFIGLGYRKVRRNANQTQRDLSQGYLRQHTVEADGIYSGLVQIELPRPPITGETLLLTVTTPVDKHRFTYRLVE